MRMANRIYQYLPEYYRRIEDFRELDKSESMELDLLQGAVDQLFHDQYVMTSSLGAIRRREQMLGIQSDPSTESLDFRRRRILNRYQTKPPFTIQYLQKQLDRLVGSGMTIVSVDPQQFLLTVTANVDNANVFREVLYTVETIKPANLVYQQNTSLSSCMHIEEHIRRQEMTWNYKLDGGWELGSKPFVSYGTEVIVK